MGRVGACAGSKSGVRQGDQYLSQGLAVTHGYGLETTDSYSKPCYSRTAAVFAARVRACCARWARRLA